MTIDVLPIKLAGSRPTFGIFCRMRPRFTRARSPSAGLPPKPDQLALPQTPVQSTTLSEMTMLSSFLMALFTRIRKGAHFRFSLPPMSSFFRRFPATIGSQYDKLIPQCSEYEPRPIDKASESSRILQCPELRSHFSRTSRYCSTNSFPVGNNSADGIGSDSSDKILRPTSEMLRDHGLNNVTWPHSLTD